MLAKGKYYGKTVYIGICRNCDHWHHSGDRCDGFFKDVRELVCDCRNWASDDNLEYLELKAFEK